MALPPQSERMNAFEEEETGVSQGDMRLSFNYSRIRSDRPFATPIRCLLFDGIGVRHPGMTQDARAKSLTERNRTTSRSAVDTRGKECFQKFYLCRKISRNQ